MIKKQELSEMLNSRCIDNKSNSNSDISCDRNYLFDNFNGVIEEEFCERRLSKS